MSGHLGLLEKRFISRPGSQPGHVRGRQLLSFRSEISPHSSVHSVQITNSHACLCGCMWVNTYLLTRITIGVCDYISMYCCTSLLMFIYVTVKKNFSLAPFTLHYIDVMMSAMASQITSHRSVYSTVYSGTDQSKQQCSASLVLVRGIHRWPAKSPQKGQWRRKRFHLITSSWLIKFDNMRTDHFSTAIALVCMDWFNKSTAYMPSKNITWISSNDVVNASVSLIWSTGL